MYYSMKVQYIQVHTFVHVHVHSIRCMNSKCISTCPIHVQCHTRGRGVGSWSN